VLGIDIGKNTFHLIGLSTRGVIVLRENAIRLEPDVALPTFCVRSNTAA